jgi:hypothetical protein
MTDDRVSGVRLRMAGDKIQMTGVGEIKIVDPGL